MSKCYVRNQIVIEVGAFFTMQENVFYSLCAGCIGKVISCHFSICSGSNCVQISVQSLSTSTSVSFVFMQSCLMLNWRPQSRSGMPSAGLVLSTSKGLCD